MPKRRANGEGNIRKRKDGRWEGRYTAGYDANGKAITKNVLGKTQAEVKDKLRTAIEDSKKLDPVKAGSSELAVADKPCGLQKAFCISQCTHYVLSRKPFYKHIAHHRRQFKFKVVFYDKAAIFAVKYIGRNLPYPDCLFKTGGVAYERISRPCAYRGISVFSDCRFKIRKEHFAK